LNIIKRQDKYLKNSKQANEAYGYFKKIFAKYNFKQEKNRELQAIKLYKELLAKEIKPPSDVKGCKSIKELLYEY
jgi:hypothetical protein